DDESFSYGLAAERTELGLTATSPVRLTKYVKENGAVNRSLPGTIGWGKDSRDSAIYTTEGTVQRAFTEIALPVMDMRYYKLNYQYQLYYPVNRDVTLLLNCEAGAAKGYGGKQLPFFKNFYAGGPGSVRGYDPNSLGPRDTSNAVLGGTRRIVGGAELMMPFPGMEKEKSVRLSGFIDAGAVYGPGDLPGSAGLRYSAGAAFTWLSPVGPLKFSYALPINRKPVDMIQKFQFTLGSIF
ncbi:MAG TPA: BamA/TamA family outer membrane protein, partial [Gallionella sp.]|nr:BamA/TamA family outer membrane protein [Gallionella sp.]